MRVRVRFTKLGQIRWIGHRDVARVWERSLRRAELPVARTEGFSPRPKMSFGLALSTGHESLGEYLDIEFLDDDPFAVGELAALPGRLNVALPDGMAVTAVAEVDPRAPSLQEDVVACRWEIVVNGIELSALTDGVAAALSAPSLVVTRTRKGHDVTDDIRPALVDAQVCGPVDGGVLIVAELATHPRSLRPSEFLSTISPGADEHRVLRTHQWIERDGARREPLPAEATTAPHARARAS